LCAVLELLDVVSLGRLEGDRRAFSKSPVIQSEHVGFITFLISSVSAAVLSMAAIVSDGLVAKKRAGSRVATREETVGNRVDALSPLVSASRTGLYIEDGMLTEHHLWKES
jgi:hypothetical protein